MKTQNNYLQIIATFYLVLVLFLLGSCISSNQTELSPAPTNIGSPSPSVEIPPFPLPTFSAQEIKDLNEMIKYDPLCSLPCWWRIIPSVSFWSDAQTVFGDLGIAILEFPSFSVDNTNFHPTSAFEIEDQNILIATNTIGIYEKDQLVRWIVIRSQNLDSVKNFYSVWKDLSPTNVIKQYGIPSRVWIEIGSIGDGNFAPYSSWFFFDHLKFLIVYSGFYEDQEELCFSFDANSTLGNVIELYIASPDDGFSLEMIYEATRGVDLSQRSDVFSTEDVFNITKENFSAGLVSDASCFKISSDIVP